MVLSYVPAYEDVKITNCRIDSIGHQGIYVVSGGSYSFSNYPFKDFTIKNCEITRVRGLVQELFSGDGIILINVDSALVDHNLVYDCGGVQDGKSGPSGIEAAQCRKVIFQYNEVYNQKSNTGSDGGGFHFGDGVQNSIMQYNYSHDNDGPGFNCYTYNSGYPLRDSNNIIRYNISSKNLRNADFQTGEICVGAGNGTTIYDIDIYNNTIYAKKFNGSAGDGAGILIARNANNIAFRNNITVSADTSIFLWYHFPLESSTNIILEGNNYWSTMQNFKFQEGTTIYRSYNSWQSNTGKEKINGVNVGDTEDPLLVNPDDAGNVNNYKTNPGSVTVENGLNLNSLFGTNPGINDFYGSSIPRGNHFDIGAYEDTSVFVIVDLTILIEGFYNSNSDTQIGDTVRLYLAESESPYTIVDVSKSYINTKGKGVFIFNADILVESGLDHYLVATHRNSIETWSSSPVNLHISGSRVYYNFTSDDSQAYGDNMVQKGSKWCIYGGDVNQDGVIELNDEVLVDNDVYNFETGYVSTDLNGDQVVDSQDQDIVGRNSINTIIIVKP
ncbi:MAG: right-handed parallel beta-helix repeat-containing protein [Ignavibacteria bacterium]|nr:right-handed parallel beta-helix repeat-containing protein [Ignavibacteria bacterium]